MDCLILAPLAILQPFSLNKFLWLWLFSYEARTDHDISFIQRIRFQNCYSLQTGCIPNV